MKNLQNLSVEELKKMASKNKIEGRSKMNKDELIQNLKKNNNMKGGDINNDTIAQIKEDIDIPQNMIEVFRYDPNHEHILMRPIGFLKGIGYLADFRVAPDYFKQFERTNNKQNRVINLSILTSLNNINMSDERPSRYYSRVFALRKNLYYLSVAGKDILVIYSSDDNRSNNIVLNEIKNQFRLKNDSKRIRFTQTLNEVENGENGENGVNFQQMYEKFYEKKGNNGNQPNRRNK